MQLINTLWELIPNGIGIYESYELNNSAINDNPYDPLKTSQ